MSGFHKFIHVIYDIGIVNSLWIIHVRRLYKSTLMVVSCTAKQSRMHDTTVCYIHERSILIERSLKAYYKKFFMKINVHCENNFVSLAI